MRWPFFQALVCLAASFVQGQSGGPFQATGIKIGEVGPQQAIIWTRLTRFREASPGDLPLDLDHLHRLPHSAPGVAGDVRVRWRAASSADPFRETPWTAVDPGSDFTKQLVLTGLRPGTAYALEVQARQGDGGPVSSTSEGHFRTSPLPADERTTRFVVTTGQEWRHRDDGDEGHRIYPVMAGLDPDFFVHTGDIVYYDKAGPVAKHPALARFKWNRMYALPHQRAFHQRVASYFIKDDHDTLKDDCWPGQRYGAITWEDGLRIFREQVPMGPLTYRTFRWGRHLQIWLVEGRDYRSPNNAPDDGTKTIWGAEQMAWFKRTVTASDATFRLLVSPTPVVGPDRGSKRDNHANAAFAREGTMLRRFLADLPGTAVVCGDRHWQYVSKDPTTGLLEFSCGPASDAHAGGLSSKPRPEHQFLRVKGGFLSVTVDNADQTPRATFRHHAVDGTVVNAHTLTRKK